MFVKITTLQYTQNIIVIGESINDFKLSKRKYLKLR